MVQDSEPLIVDAGARLEQLFRDFESGGAPGAKEASTFGLRITGVEAGSHLLTLGPDGASWDHDWQGDPAADVEITMEFDDLIAIIDGRIDARLAVASERIDVDGNLQTARHMLGMLTPDLAEE